MLFRENTNDDHVYSDVFINNEYKIGQFSPEDIVIDIGGHIGSFALRAWENNSREVYCYEPFILNYASLLKNTFGTTIHCYRFAIRGNYRYRTVSSQIGQNIKEQEKKNLGGICIGVGLDVYVKTLEDLIYEISPSKKIKLLKLDCEGSEYSIIMESPRYIFDKIEKIVGELHSGDLPINYVNNKPVNHTEFIDYLKSLGYEVSYVPNAENPEMAHFFAEKKDK